MTEELRQVEWFCPERPVNGTVYVKPEADDTVVPQEPDLVTEDLRASS